MKNLLVSLCAIIALVACTESDVDNIGNNSGGQEIPKQPEITLSTTAADFSTDGGSNVITFTSSEDWTAEVVNTRADDWCSIEPTSGPAGSAKITITTTENDTPDDRTASIIIKAGTASKTINVSQKQKDALTVTSSKFEVSAEGGEITIEVKANINFDFEIDDDAEDWITHRSTRALKTSQLVFEIDENEATENRKANISISSGNLRETVTIYQEGNEPTIVLSDDEFTVSSSKETIAIDVKSNVDVAVEIPSNVNWIKENTTRTYSTNTYYFDIAQNDGYDARTAEIEFVNKENGVYEKVKITQMQRDAIVVAENSYTVDSYGDEIVIEVGHNIDFDIEIADDWISQKETRAFVTDKLTFVVAENTTDKARESSITFTSKDGNIVQKISITQSYAVHISLNKSNASMLVDDEITLKVTITPGNAENTTILWSSSNPKVASVVNGKVKAHKLGTTTITAKTQDGRETASCTISVVEINSLIDFEFVSWEVHGGVTFEGSLIKLPPGNKMGVAITNNSSHNVILTGFKLICGKYYINYEYSIKETEIRGNTELRFTATNSYTIYAPIAEITYRYGSKTYTARTQFNGSLG